MTVAAFSIGHHARVPVQMIREIQKPRALQILNHLLTLCGPEKPEVWVDQALIGRVLGIHQDTVGRWVRYLVKIGSLISLGYHNDGRRKRYKINLNKNENVAKGSVEVLAKSFFGKKDDFTGRPQAIVQEDLRQIDRTINKEEITIIKEQTVVVDFSKEEPSQNEIIALKQKLVEIGLHKKVIDKLVYRFSAEKIKTQVDHLFHLLGNGEKIQKPSAWLVAAIENGYSLPKKMDKTALIEEQNEEIRRQASLIAQRAKSEFVDGKLEAAKKSALESLEKVSNNLAKEVLKEANELIERNQKIVEIRAQIKPDLIEQIRQEVEEKKVRELKRWFKSESQVRATLLFQKSVEEMINQRLLESDFGRSFEHKLDDEFKSEC